MNYRHSYHAGSFADVIKHLVLMMLVQNLAKKESPFTVMDCFAGRGHYDLEGSEALKTGESIEGIKKLQNSSADMPVEIANFLSFVKTLPENYYPGSPLIIENGLNKNGTLIGCELHPEDFYSLKRLFFGRKNASIHHLNAYNAIKAFLPFKNNRGLIFIDPPFEVKDEFIKIIEALKVIRKKAFNNQVLVWYPIKNDTDIRNFLDCYNAIGFKEALNIEIELPVQSKYPSFQKSSLKSSGLLIINPPDCFNSFEQILSFLKRKHF